MLPKNNTEGVTVRKIFILLLILLALIGLAACGNKPENTAKAFFKALEIQDFELAKKLATPEGQELLSIIQSFSENISEEQKAELMSTRYQVLKSTIDGDVATVQYEQWDTKTPDQKETHSLQMKKLDGAWKVHFVKDDIQK
jgi:hypothetical protein